MRRERLGFLAFSCLALGLVYQGIFREFAWGDDFTNLYQFAEGPCPEWVSRWATLMSQEGRPLLAPLQCLLFRPCPGIPGLALVRTASLLGILAFANQLYDELRRREWKTWAAAGAALTASSTPALGVLAGWASVWPFSWAMALGFAAGQLSLELGPGPAVLAVLAQLAALMIYQSSAMAFLIPVVLRLDQTRRGGGALEAGRLLRAGLLFGATLAAYLICYKSGIWPFPPQPSGRSKLDPLASSSLWPGYLTDAFALSALVGPGLHLAAAITVGAIVLAGYLRSWTGVACLAFLPASFLPCLAVSCGCPWLRTHAVLQGLTAVLLFSVLQDVRGGRAVAMALTLAALGLAWSNLLNGFVLPKQRLLRATQRMIQPEPFPDLGQWLYVRSSQPVNPDYPGEYSANLALNHDWDFEAFVRELLWEADHRRHEVQVKVGEAGEAGNYRHLVNEWSLIVASRASRP